MIDEILAVVVGFVLGAFVVAVLGWRFERGADCEIARQIDRAEGWRDSSRLWESRALSVVQDAKRAAVLAAMDACKPGELPSDAFPGCFPDWSETEAGVHRPQAMSPARPDFDSDNPYPCQACGAGHVTPIPPGFRCSACGWKPLTP